MKANYQDIKKRINETPKWFDSNGTPRYDKFHPKLSPNIYADEVVLMKIACQYCGKRFFVEMNWNNTDRNIRSLHERIKTKTVRYLDPPNDCCAMGVSACCCNLKIIQFWTKIKTRRWKRDKKYEIKLTT